MGILKSGPNGPFRKKTGSVIGRNHRSQNLITSLYNISDKPPTEKQLLERMKFGLLNNFLTNIEALVKPGFIRYAKVKSAINAAYSYNVAHAFVKYGEEWQINFPKMVYSRGHIDTPEGAAIVPNALHHTISFNWLAQKQTASCQFSDLACLLVYNASKNKAVIQMNAASRYARSYQFSVPDDFVGDVLHWYMNFAAADGKQAGDSIYLGELLFS